MTDSKPKAPAATKPPVDPVVMAIDVGGSHVKFRLSNSPEEHRDVSGPDMTGQGMIDKVKALAKGLSYDVIAIGFPGPVVHGKVATEPFNLGKGWVGVDFAAAFGKPVRLLNDALMQAIGSYDGGRMLFLGLGTGLGSAMIVDYAAQPLELAHMPYRKGRSYEDYVGEAAREKRGNKKWRHDVADVIATLSHAMEPDYVVLGGGNAERVKELPANCRMGDNANAFTGGFRTWLDPKFGDTAQDALRP